MVNRNTRQSPGGRWYQDDEFQTSPQSSREMSPQSSRQLSPLFPVDHITGKTKRPWKYRLAKGAYDVLTNPYVDLALGTAAMYGLSKVPFVNQLGTEAMNHAISGVKYIGKGITDVRNRFRDKFHKIPNMIERIEDPEAHSAESTNITDTNTTNTNTTNIVGTNSTATNATDIIPYEAGNHSEYL